MEKEALKKLRYILIDYRKTTILIFIKDPTLEGLVFVTLEVSKIST